MSSEAIVQNPNSKEAGPSPTNNFEANFSIPPFDRERAEMNRRLVNSQNRFNQTPAQSQNQVDPAQKINIIHFDHQDSAPEPEVSDSAENTPAVSAEANPSISPEPIDIPEAEPSPTASRENTSAESLEDPAENSGVEQGSENLDTKSPEAEKANKFESRIEELESKIKNIEQEIESAKANKANLKEELEAYEQSISENLSEYNQLLERGDSLKVEINRTKRSLIGGFSNGLKMIKNLALGKHQAIRDLLHTIEQNVADNEKAVAEKDQNDKSLDKNRQDQQELERGQKATIEQDLALDQKINRLEEEKASLEKKTQLLKEESANQAWAEAWSDAQEGIKSEMGFNNVQSFKESLISEREQKIAEMKQQMNSFNDHVINAIVAVMGENDPDQARNKVELIKSNIVSQYESEIATIDAKLNKVEQYFPSWQARVNNLTTKGSIATAVSDIARKALLRIYGLA